MLRVWVASARINCDSRSNTPEGNQYRGSFCKKKKKKTPNIPNHSPLGIETESSQLSKRRQGCIMGTQDSNIINISNRMGTRRVRYDFSQSEILGRRRDGRSRYSGRGEIFVDGRVQSYGFGGSEVAIKFSDSAVGLVSVAMGFMGLHGFRQSASDCRRGCNSASLVGGGRRKKKKQKMKKRKKEREGLERCAMADKQGVELWYCMGIVWDVGNCLEITWL